MRSADVVESLYLMELTYATPDRELDRQCPVGRSVGGYPLQGRGFRRGSHRSRCNSEGQVARTQP
jgi:hypothetical protein